MICPVCKENNEKSSVMEGMCMTTCMYCPSYYDEDGNYHSHDSNITTSEYHCSKGHSFSIKRTGTCPSCDFGKNSEEIIVNKSGHPHYLFSIPPPLMKTVEVLPYDPNEKLEVLTKSMLYLYSVELSVGASNYNRKISSENWSDEYKSILKFISKQTEVYFVTNLPNFEYPGTTISVGTLSFSIDNTDTILNCFRNYFNNGKLFCFYSLMEEKHSNGLVSGYRLRGAGIPNTSHLIADIKRDKKIDIILDN